MSGDPEPTALDAIEGAGQAVDGSQSLLDSVIASREEIRGEHHLDLEVPGYKGVLWLRFKLIPFKQTEQMGERLRRESKKLESMTLTGAIDTLIAGCEQVMLKDGDTLHPIDPAAEPPVKLEQRLAELLRFEADTARKVVRELFGNDYAITQTAVRLSRWMTDTTREVDEDFLGEI